MSIDPATRTSELMIEIDRAGEAGAINDIQAAAFRRDAREVYRVARVEGCMLLGNIEGWRWNPDGVKVHLDEALNRSGFSASVYYTLSRILDRVGDYVGSFEACKRASDLEKMNLTFLRSAINDANILGLYTEALDLMVEYSKRSPERPPEGLDDQRIMVNRIDSAGVAPDLASRCHQVAMTLLTENRIRVVGGRFDVDEEQRTGGVFCLLEAEASQAILDDLDDELAARLFDQIPDLDFNTYWVGYEAKV